MKLSHDPNNTRWTGNKESFGHKIMASQGWKEGQYLGAVDASHAEHYTAANASHIKVSIKDDNLGLGAKIGSGVGAGQCTGLDAFKNILGRLNGKDEDEIEKEQRSRDELKRAIYTERKWGSVRFVRGGFLIGDKIQDLIDGEAERIRTLDLVDSSSSDESSSSDSESEVSAPVESSKRKRKLDVTDSAEEVEGDKKMSKKRKLKVEKTAEVVAVKVKKSKKVKKDRKEKKSRSEPVQEDGPETKTDSIELEKSDRRRRKEEKKEKKARKEKKREEGGTKKKTKDRPLKAIPKSTLDQLLDSSEERKSSNPSTSSLPGSGRATPMMQGRHAVRSRNIAQKRLASMDVAALNQVSILQVINPLTR